MNHFSVILAEEGPLGHVLDRVLIGNPGWSEFIGPVLTMNTLTMLIVAALMVVVMLAAAKSIDTSRGTGDDRYVTKGVFPQMIEVIVTYLRDKVIQPQLGPETRKFTPFLLTLFFFILFNNLMGLVPLLDLQHLVGAAWGDTHFAIVGGTATGRIAVTAALAVMAFILWQINGIRSAGVVAWAKHYMGGGPWYLAPIMVPVEIMGTFVKPFALALRLFANMTAGHVLLAVLISFTAAAPAALGALWGTPITLVALFGSVAIYLLEIFVAFLQAFIFMFLTTLFIAQLAHHHHDEHAHAHEYDGDHSLETDPAVPVSAV